MPSDLSTSFDDLLNTVADAGPKIHLQHGVWLQLLKRREMSRRQIFHVNVIPNACAVFGWVVCPKNRNVGPLT
jgi:hypothetical protein